MEDRERYRIAWLSAEFSVAGTEAAFREHIRADWVRETRLAITIAALFYLAFAMTDFLVLGVGQRYLIIFLTRLMVCALGLAVALSADRFWRPLVDGITPTLVESMALIGFLSITLLRPYEVGWHGMSLMAMLLGVYVFIPNRFLPKLAVALPSTLACVWLLDEHFQLPINQLLPLSLLLLVVNLFGILSAHRVSGLRRETFRDEQILRRTNRALFEEIEERRRLEQHLRELARLDDLTGIHNRRGFFDLAQQEISVLQRSGETLSLLLLEVDYFKQIGDTYGGVRANEVLQTLVKLCRHHLREGDLFARAGGESFVILLPRAGRALARQIAERLRVEARKAPVALSDATIHFSISIGLAEWRRDETIGDLLARADQALQIAKFKGNNRVESAPDTNAEGAAEVAKSRVALERGDQASQNGGSDSAPEHP